MIAPGCSRMAGRFDDHLAGAGKRRIPVFLTLLWQAHLDISCKASSETMPANNTVNAAKVGCHILNSYSNYVK